MWRSINLTFEHELGGGDGVEGGSKRTSQVEESHE